MRTAVVMPQMGESIAEGTRTKWLKKVGDRVQRDEPLFEISTDKVDAEIPAAASGVLKGIRGQPGATGPGHSTRGRPGPRPRLRGAQGSPGGGRGPRGPSPPSSASSGKVTRRRWRRPRLP